MLMARREPVQPLRVCRSRRAPLTYLGRLPPRLLRVRAQPAGRACPATEAVTAQPHHRSYREVTTTLSLDGYARQPSRKRIRSCGRSCGRNTQTTAKVRPQSDDRWIFVSAAVRAEHHDPSVLVILFVHSRLLSVFGFVF